MLFTLPLPFQDAVDRGWLLDEASHFSGVLGLNRLLLTALELAKALAYLHRLDILHGDLTGGNVMLTSQPATQDDPRGFTVKVCTYPQTLRTNSKPERLHCQGRIFLVSTDTPSAHSGLRFCMPLLCLLLMLTHLRIRVSQGSVICIAV